MIKIQRMYGSHCLEVLNVQETGRSSIGSVFSCTVRFDGENLGVFTSSKNGDIKHKCSCERIANIDKILSDYCLNSKFDINKARESYGEYVAKKLEEQKCTIVQVVPIMAAEFLDEVDRSSPKERFIYNHQNNCLCFEGSDGELVHVKIASMMKPITELYNTYDGRIKIEKIIQEYSELGYSLINKNI